MSEPPNTLFPVEGLRPIPPTLGYRAPIAATAAGITYRQLDYWARTGLVEPSLAVAHGSGSSRSYSFRDILTLRLVKQLLTAGVSLAMIRAVIGFVADLPDDQLANATVVADGVTVWQVNDPGEVVDLLTASVGIIGIAVPTVWRDLETYLADVPGETPTGQTVTASRSPAGDEFTARRLRKTG